MALVSRRASYEEAKKSISEKEIQEGTRYILVASTKDTRKTNIQSIDGLAVHFEDRRGDIHIPFTGVPFCILGTEVWECHQGPNRKKKEKQPKDDSEHTYINPKKRKRMIQVSKKMGCQAKIKMRAVISFPKFKIEGADSSYRRKAVSKRLKTEFESLSDADKHYNVYLSFSGTHNDHLIGEDSRFIQPLDKGISNKIKDLVLNEGVRSAAEIKKLIEIHTKSLPQSDIKSRRFSPTMQDIRNHMFLALQNSSFTNDDQTRVMSEIQKWQEIRPQDHFYFQPSSEDSSGESKSLLFVHQTEYQKRLLHKYGQQTVLMDSTYKTTKYNLPLYLICVLTSVGYYVVASFIIQQDTTKEICNALEMIKKWNSDWYPSSFMCDLDMREINACETVFKECIVFTCAFHREQSWSRWLSKVSNKLKDSKGSILEMLRKIANSNSEDELHKHVDSLKESDAYKHNLLFKGWMDRIWLNNLKVIEWLHDSLADLMKFDPHPTAISFRKPATSARIATLSGVPKTSRLYRTFYEYGLTGKYILYVLLKEALINFMSTEYKLTYKQCHEICQSSEFDRQEIFGK